MIKKIRFIKNNPLAKVGEVFAGKDGGESIHINGHNYFPNEISQWIKDGWCEEVREKESLEKKYKDALNKDFYKIIYSPYELSKIAREHVLEVFDEAWEVNMDESGYPKLPNYESIRRKLEEGIL